ncbi:MAG: DUF4386 domain-containing protein [Reinekea sp.]|nr:DUF4386 domain-containing protein [Reinekea sp.]
MNTQINPNSIARRAGWLYLLLIPLGFFGLMYVPEVLLVADNPQATFANIQANEMGLRLSVLAAFSIQVIQIFIALALYDLFKHVDRTWSQIIVIFTLAAMPVALLNELSRVAVLYFIHDSALTALFTTEQLQQAVLFLLDLNEDGIMIAHIFWGVWLLPMGVLILKSDFIPKIIGWMMVLAFFGYIADTVVWLLIPGETIDVALYTFYGEVILPLWLVIKGVKQNNWQSWAANSAAQTRALSAA